MNPLVRVFESREDAKEYLKTLAPLRDVVESARVDAKRHSDSAAESFARCDTDGFVTQFVSTLSSEKAKVIAEVAATGGCDVFACLTDLNGNLVSTDLRSVRSKFHYGYERVWVVKRPGSRRAEWVNDPKRDSTLEKKGLKRQWVVAPAEVYIAGHGTGLSGLASCRVSVKIDRVASGISV